MQSLDQVDGEKNNVLGQVSLALISEVWFKALDVALSLV